MISSLMLAAIVQAAPATPDKAKEERTIVRQIIVHEDKDGNVTHSGHGRPDILVLRDEKDLPKDGERREIRILRGGEPGKHLTMLADCKDGRKFEAAAEGVDKDKPVKTKFLICAKGNKSDADMTEALERAAKRLSEDKEMPADVRARVLASLNQEIARLKGGK